MIPQYLGILHLELIIKPWSYN